MIRIFDIKKCKESNRNDHKLLETYNVISKYDKYVVLSIFKTRL